MLLASPDSLDNRADALSIVNELSRRARQDLSVQGSDGPAVRWGREAVGEKSVLIELPAAETTSARIRRQRLQEQRTRPQQHRPSSSIVISGLGRSDPRESMRMRQQKLLEAREKRRRLEIEYQTRILEQRAAAGSRARLQKPMLEHTESLRQHMDAALSHARSELEAEAALFAREVEERTQLRMQQHARVRLQEQLVALQHLRVAHRTAKDAAHAVVARTDGAAMSVPGLYATVFRAWREVLLAAVRRKTLARNHWSWRLCRRVWGAWKDEWWRAHLAAEARLFEEVFRTPSSSSCLHPRVPPMRSVLSSLIYASISSARTPR